MGGPQVKLPDSRSSRMDQAQHIIDYPPAVWNFKETWKQIVHYDARSLNAIERDGAVGKGEGAVEGRRGRCVRHIQRNRNE